MRWISKLWAPFLVFALVFAASVPQFATASLDPQTPVREAVSQPYYGPGATHADSPGRSTNRSGLAQHVAFALPTAACSLSPAVIESLYAGRVVPQPASTALCGPATRAPPVVSSFC